MHHFMRQHGHDNYASLHQWSIDEAAEFWTAVCEFYEIEFDRPPDTVLSRPDNIMHAGWFDGAKLNFAAHLLRHTGTGTALVFCGEDGTRRPGHLVDLRRTPEIHRGVAGGDRGGQDQGIERLREGLGDSGG